jgi:DNA polymerase I-like protein with 3'-5' exonuclease and polymerase domains
LSKKIEYIGHNIINYDIELIKKITGLIPNETAKITDTLVMSYLGNPDRPRPPGYSGKGGPHSLEAWGYRVGKAKPDHKDWLSYDPAMVRRCREDMEINHLCYHTLQSEVGKLTEALEREYEISRLIAKQEHHGILFDKQKALEYIRTLSEKIGQIDREIIPKLPKTLVRIGSVPVNEPFLKTGGYRKQTQAYLDESYPEQLHRNLVGGPFNRIRFDSFNIGSTEKVKSYLLEHGWLPDYWNYSKTTGERTSPKLEGSFRGVDGEIPRRIKERISVLKRRSIIEGWINRLRDDGRLSAGAIPNGTNTGRMKHYNVANVPKANTYKQKHLDKKIITDPNLIGQLIWDTDHQKDLFGTQMRSLFIAPEGFKLVGHDASGLEFRMLAHYMGDEELIDFLSDPDGDIHEFNRTKAGLESRDDAKTLIYAFLYGAGNEKIGSIVGGDARDGEELKRRFLDSLPNLERLIKRVKRASGKGYLKGLDGRQVMMRRHKDGRIMQHKALNTLLQHSGSIVMKQSCIMLWDDIEKTDITAYKVLDMHDEGQSEVLIPDVEHYSHLAVKSIEDAGKYFDLKIPLLAEAKVGNNWAETH